MDNLRLADAIARKGKAKQDGVKRHLLNEEENLQALHEMLVSKTYKTSTYSTFTIFEPKERQIFSLPYFPDRILHHAVMNVMENIFVSMFTADTYSCIKGRGIHKASNNLRKELKHEQGATYCLKLDIKKFYPSVDHAILKSLLRRKIKDNNLLWLLDEIIDSAEGLPIGNYLSQYLSNFYLTYFDHWLKDNYQVKYFRYADDMVLLSDNKSYLHKTLNDIREYLAIELNLAVKNNYRVFPVSAGIDFVGYVHYPKHVLLRKTIKKSFARAVARGAPKATIASYMGWAKHCNSKHLIKKLFPHEQL